MKIQARPLPIFTAAAGAFGLLAQFWLLSATDAKGLLPARHPALAVIWGLTLIMLVVLLIISRRCQRFPLHEAEAFPLLGNLAAATGICITSITQLKYAADPLTLLTGIAGLAGAAMLLALLSPRFQAYQFFQYLLLCLYTIAHTICQYRQWSTHAQLMRYVFPLLGSVLIMLYCYYRASLCLTPSHPRKTVFFNQAALFCCCLAIPSGSCHVLYSAAAIWLFCDLYAPVRREGGLSHADS